MSSSISNPSVDAAFLDKESPVLSTPTYYAPATETPDPIPASSLDATQEKTKEVPSPLIEPLSIFEKNSLDRLKTLTDVIEGAANVLDKEAYLNLIVPLAKHILINSKTVKEVEAVISLFNRLAIKSKLLAKTSYGYCSFMGAAYSKLNNPTTAYILLTQAAESPEVNPEDLMYLAVTLKNLDQLPEKQEEILRKIIAMDAEAYQAWFNLAVLLYEKQDYDKAKRGFEAAIALKPSFPEALNMLGLCLIKEEKAQEALACFIAATDLAETYWDAWYNMCKILHENGYEEDCQKIFDTIPTDWIKQNITAAVGKSLEEEAQELQKELDEQESVPLAA